MSNDAEEKSSRVPLTVIPSTNSVFTTGPSEPGILLAAAPDPAPAVEPWKTVEYEVWMFFGLRDPQRASDDPIVRNALTEATVLYARILCEIFIDAQKYDDDIRLQTLYPDLKTKPEYAKPDQLTTCLDQIYGKSGVPGSYRSRFHKFVMHATSGRDAYGIYEDALIKLEPIIREVVHEIEDLRKQKFLPID